jgi:Arm DNA-binding domain
MPKITKQVVDALAANSADQVLWDKGDGALKGFGVRMKPSGVASYLIQYRNAAGVSRRLTLGRVGVLTPDQARKLAKAKLAEVAGGADPAEAKAEAPQEMKVGELCTRYLTEARAGRILGRRGKPIKASTLDSDGSRITSHVLPLIGNKPVSWLTLPNIGQFQNDVTGRQDGGASQTRPRRHYQRRQGHRVAYHAHGARNRRTRPARRQSTGRRQPARRALRGRQQKRNLPDGRRTRRAWPSHARRQAQVAGSPIHIHISN